MANSDKLIAYLNGDGFSREVSRLSSREISATIYGVASYGSPHVELAVVKRNDGVPFVHLTRFGSATSGKRAIIDGVPLADVVQAFRAPLLSEQDISDIAGALRIVLDSQPEKRDAILAKLNGRP
jgi:hypothetical protein